MLALAPNNAESYMTLAFILNAVERPEQAMWLNPHPPAWYFFTLGTGYRLLGQYEEALAILKELRLHSPDFFGTHIGLALVYGELGRDADARAAVAEMRRVSPKVSLEGLRRSTMQKNQAVLA